MNSAATLILFYPMLVFMKLGMCSDCTDTRCLMYSLRVSIVAFKLELNYGAGGPQKKPILSLMDSLDQRNWPLCVLWWTPVGLLWPMVAKPHHLMTSRPACTLYYQYTHLQTYEMGNLQIRYPKRAFLTQIMKKKQHTFPFDCLANLGEGLHILRKFLLIPADFVVTPTHKASSQY